MKKLFTQILCLFVTTGLFAQPVINSSFNPKTGDVFRFHPVNTKITEGSSGANVTWDFSTIHIIWNAMGGKYMNPSATPYVNDFPGADVVYESFFAPGTYHYYYATSTALEKIGEASFQVTAVYNSPQTIITYPFTYNSKTTDNYSCNTTIGSLDLDIIGLWEAEGDAYGTLILPSGTYNNVLRIRITNEFTKDYNDPGQAVEGTEGVEFWYVSSTSNKPLLKIIREHYTRDGNPYDSLAISMVSEEVSGISHPDRAITNLRLFPNPATDVLHVGFEMENSAEVAMAMVTVDGRTIKEYGREAMSPGSYLKELSLDGLASGIYLLRVDAGEAPKMFRVVKQ